MNKTLATRTGIITSILIIAYNLILIAQKVPPSSPLTLIQFLILFIGICFSAFFLQKYYAGITFFDYLKHCLGTLSTIIFLVVVSNVILFFVLKDKADPLSNITWLIMKVIFSFSLSGILSAFFTSFIFNTFTKNK
jgi:hypothetical protein